MKGFLGIDVGSVSTNLVMIDQDEQVMAHIYRRTRGQPIVAVQEGLQELAAQLPEDVEVAGAGTTGSARSLSGVIVGADIVKNEITAHAIAAKHVVPDVRTVLEIGGQDSKVILLQDGVVVDFAMNTVCAAGTGSFLDHQSARLGIPIEEFGDYALRSKSATQIAGRCSVFAESDMVHKQQIGHNIEDIIYGLCKALVRNYLNNLAKGRELAAPLVFQGGVAANAGMKRAFEEAIGEEVVIPEYFPVMGAIGSALLAKVAVPEGEESKFKGFSVSDLTYDTSNFTCKGCANTCEIVKISIEGEVLARWGSRCGKWEVEERVSAAKV
ncbi:MAG: 2-hydroxyglutaryl-CoA dehydratase [Actinobacteria bacterium]|nr:MAG: 2-hydroxyglutaryl-CoA dehydratase [Actinomycetota bacterium]